MDLKFCKNIAKDEYELLLHGVVGEEINGRQVASEILYLNSIGAKVIKERINTIGGTIMDAYAIVSANITSECEIHTVNEGVADSSGSFILASGTNGKRSAMDFATMLVHNTSYKGVMLEDMEDSPIKKELEMMRDSIVTILSNNSNLTSEEIKNLMNESTRMSAQQALDYGFIDNIIKSINTPKIVENMSMTEIMNLCRDNQNNNDNSLNKENKMKSILNYLNLSEDAQEASALQAVQNISTRAESAEGKVDSLTSEVDGLKNQVTEKDSTIADLNAKVKEFENKEKGAAVDAAIQSGKFSEDKRESLTEQVEAIGVENFNKMVEMASLPTVNVLEQIDNKGEKGEKKSPDQKLADEYQNLSKDNPSELMRIKNEEPARFEKMFNAWNEA